MLAWHLPSSIMEGIAGESEYDIFERTSEGFIIWCDVMYGREKAMRRLQELAAHSENEHFVFHVPSKSVLARANANDFAEVT
jgi:hypothetical protein